MLDPGVHWLRLAHRLRRKINFAIWLDRAAVPGVIVAGISAASILLARHYWPQLAEVWQWCTALVPITLSLTISWAINRRHYIALQQALIRLECRLHLNSALSTAYEGAGPWPPPSPATRDGLRWSWLRSIVPTLLMAGLILTAWLMPVDAPATGTTFTEPATWKLLENNLDHLVQNELVDKSSTEDARKAIEALRQRPQGEWFDHSSIEAGDRILRNHQRDLSELEGRLRQTSHALRELAEARKGMHSEGPPPNAAFNDLMEELRMGGLTPDADLLKRIAELQGGGDNPLNQLDPRQLAELLDQIEGNAQQLSEMLDQMKAQQGQGNGGQQPGPNGQGNDPQPGQGAPNRGPGEGGPIEGNPKDLDLEKPLHTPLAAGDISRSLPGDYLGEGEATHDIDPNRSPELRAGGAASQPGDGGGAVWQESLHPREQEALRRFFEK